MPEQKIVFVLPPFAHDYPASPFDRLTGYNEYFHNFLSDASLFDTDLSDFDFQSKTFLDDQLKSQYMAYIMACSLGRFLEDKKCKPSVLAGFSMGLYAALYLSGAIDFRTGLEIIQNAFIRINEIVSDERYSMGSITGLSKDDIGQLCTENAISAGIAIQNSICSFLVSGKNREIEKLMELAHTEGALSTRMLGVTIPYHSKYLKNISPDFILYLETIRFKSPVIPVVSLIDQKMIRTSDEIRNEIIRNISTPLNWYRTQLYLQEKGFLTFVECGPGKSLVKNSKFIEGDASFMNVNSYFSHIIDDHDKR